ncbi:MAG: hypothetical protein LBG89_01670 [Rickettsiales bacterium]|jgi:hypothetical protein|nr:hypothetical protein [Rickettsiales bacterium]
MAFQNKNLSVIAYANGFTLWHYAAEDTLAQIAASDYFAPALSMINPGDMLLASGKDGNGAVKTFKILNGVITTTAI